MSPFRLRRRARTGAGATAQDYTPIAYSLEQAASDFPADAKERIIVLVSDGLGTRQLSTYKIIAVLS